MGKEKSRVVIIPCEDYEREKVYRAVKAGLSLLGGIERFVKPEEKILVKPNFLSAADADKAVVTHPSVIRAVLRILSEAGCAKVKYGDSPAHGSSRQAAEKIGLRPDTTYGAVLAPMDEEAKTRFEDGILCKGFVFTKDAVEADAIINLCKMKTHALQGLTGAVKNTFGLVCGMNKAAMHVKYPGPGEFASYLVDIQRWKKPRFAIMDGIMAMEGNGPGSGDPTPMKVLLFSEDPVALDAVFALLVGAKAAMVPTIGQGEVMGLGRGTEDGIEIVTLKAEAFKKNAEGAVMDGASNAGSTDANEAEEAAEVLSFKEAFDRFGRSDFKIDRRSFLFGIGAKILSCFSSLSRRPYIVQKDCVRCGVCVNHCPVEGGAVTFAKGKDHAPVYDYKKCVRCYCCQEICPQKAIHVKTGM